MDLEAAFILELWDVFRDKIPAKEREDVAYSFLKLLNDWDIDVLSMRDLREEDNHIDSALELLKDEDEEEVEHEYDE
jgi:hypothetical protein